MIKTAEIKYKEYWLIRVIKDSITSKKVVKEIEYQAEPTEQDILEVLLKCNADEFISVSHNYRL